MQAVLDVARASDDRLEAELVRLGDQVRTQQGRVDGARRVQAAAQAAVASNQQRIAVIVGRMAAIRARLVDRAVDAYMRPQPASLGAITDAGDASRASRGLALLGVVQDRAADLSDQLEADRKDLDVAQDALARARAQAEARGRLERSALEVLAAVRRRHQTAQAELDQRIAELQAESRELAAQQARIEQVLRSEEAARAAELARQQAAKAGRPWGGSPAAARFTWPIRGRVTSEFGPRWGGFHSGLDIADPAGTPVAAAADGVVAFAGVMDAYGELVLVDHGGGFVTGYAHNSALTVTKGQAVEQGQTVARVGSTGRSTGNHLHFEVRVDGSPRDPRAYLP